MNEILVSVITPCFTAEKYLENTFNCLLKQTHQNWEWIVVDDLSRDNSWLLLNKIASRDSRVRIYQNPKNSGASVSRNKGLDESRGEYVAFLDADDEWLESKLEVQLKFMIDNKIALSCHDYVMMSEQGENLRPVNSAFDLVSQVQLRAFNPIATSFVMLKKSAIGDLRFDPSLRRRQDWVFWYELLGRIGKGYFLHQHLGRYRKDSANSISSNKFKMAQLQWKIYREYFKQSYPEAVRSLIQYVSYGVKKHYLK